MSENRKEFYELWKNSMTNYFTAIGVNFDEFTKKFNMNVLEPEEFLSEMIWEDNDMRIDYPSRLKEYKGFKSEFSTSTGPPIRYQIFNLVSDEWSPEQCKLDGDITREEIEAEIDYIDEDIYLDDLKSFAKLNSSLLRYYKAENIESWSLDVDQVLQYIKNDERFMKNQE